MIRGLLTGFVAGLLLVGVLIWANPGGTPLCPEGSSPATNPRVTSTCFPDDAELPDGFTRDPGGNRRTS